MVPSYLTTIIIIHKQMYVNVVYVVWSVYGCCPWWLEGVGSRSYM